MSPLHLTAAGLLALAAAAAQSACSSGPGSSTPPALGSGDDGGGRDATAPGADAGPDVGADGPSSQGDAPADGPRDGNLDGPTTYDVSIDVQPLLPCGPSPIWGQPVTVLTTPGADSTIFGAITNDELTIAWTSSTGGVVTAWYADRTSNNVAFATPQALATSFGALAMDRVTISGDGLRIVGVKADGSGFVAAKRADRTSTFDTDDSAEFAGFAPDGSSSPTYASPMLSPDNQVLAYLLTSSVDDNDLLLASGPGWSKSVSTGLPELARVNGQQRRPTGMTQDDLSVFYWDEVSGTEKAVYLGDTPPLFAEFGPWEGAVPTGACSRIYYSTPATGGAITIVYVGQSGNM